MIVQIKIKPGDILIQPKNRPNVAFISLERGCNRINTNYKGIWVDKSNIKLAGNTLILLIDTEKQYKVNRFQYRLSLSENISIKVSDNIDIVNGSVLL